VKHFLIFDRISTIRYPAVNADDDDAVAQYSTEIANALTMILVLYLISLGQLYPRQKFPYLT